MTSKIALRPKPLEAVATGVAAGLAGIDLSREVAGTGLSDGVGSGEAAGLGLSEAVGLGETAGLGLSEAVGLGEKVGLGLAEPVRTAEKVTLRLSEDVGFGLCVKLALGMSGTTVGASVIGSLFGTLLGRGVILGFRSFHKHNDAFSNDAFASLHKNVDSKPTSFWVLVPCHSGV
jgi:hypothetical protein